MPPLLKLWIDEVFDMRWISESGLNILSGKEAIIVTTVGGRASGYTKEGKYGADVETLLSGLKVSLKVNHIDLKKILVFYNADVHNPAQLDGYCEELSKILSIE